MVLIQIYKYFSQIPAWKSPHKLFGSKLKVLYCCTKLWVFKSSRVSELHIPHIFKTVRNFLTKFWYYDQIVSRNSFTCLKSQTSAHVQLMISLLYMLLANTLTWYQLETYMKDTPWWMGSQDDVFNLVTWLFLGLLILFEYFVMQRHGAFFWVTRYVIYDFFFFIILFFCIV